MSRVKRAPVYSNAMNFADFLTGGVDPRTGLYTYALSLGQMCSGFMNGPALAINLQFNPLNTASSGFGIGWTLPQSTYDIRDATLSLSNGERYRMETKGDRLIFAEQNVKNVQVKILAPDQFEMSHKSGLREQLKTLEGGYLAVPVKIISANGASLSLEYEIHDDGPRLIAVSSAERVLLQIQHTETLVRLIRDPGSSHESVFRLECTEDRLTGIRLPTGQEWSFVYEDMAGLLYITQVDTGVGARESISYAADGHLLSAESGLRSVPYVISHSVSPGQGQLSITTDYQFSQTHFLGSGFNDEGLDPLYRMVEGYTYTSTQNQMVGNRSHRSIVRTYDKYHLLVAQVTQCEQTRLTELTRYHLKPDLSFAEQPAQFRLPLFSMRRYEDLATGATREEHTRTEFDEFGNLLRQIDPCGVQAQYEFYPAEGALGCPADPLEFVRFLKQCTVYPAPGLAAAQVTRRRYTYLIQGGMAGASVPHLLRETEQNYVVDGQDEQLCAQTSLLYLNVPDDAMRHGLVAERQSTVGGKTSSASLEYDLEPEGLAVKTVTLGFDGVSHGSRAVYSVFNGLKLFEQESGSPAVVSTYDAIGRMLSQSVAANTSSAANQTWEYQLARGRTLPATKVMTDVNKQRQRTLFDGLGRVIRIDELGPVEASAEQFEPYKEIYSVEYDALGQLIAETCTDWLNDRPRPLKSTFIYDAWGELRTTLHPSGLQQHTSVDPVANNRTDWLDGAAKTLTHFNEFAKPVSVELLDTRNRTLGVTRYVYDGLGRCVSQIDPEANTTTYQYDFAARLQRCVLPDNSVVETEYAAHSHAPLPVAITVAGRTLGTQVFDSLGRLARSTTGGRETTQEYAAAGDKPLAVVNPDGARIEYTYDQNLGGVTTQRKVGAVLTSLEYEPATGHLVKCIEGQQSTRYEYNQGGHVTRETTVGEVGEKSQSFSYSLAGRLLKHIDVFGKEHKTDYDQFWRPCSYESPEVKASLSYNSLGLLTTIDVRQVNGTVRLVTRLAYDDLGRENRRAFELNGAATHVLRSVYSATNKLTHRTLHNGGEVLRDETFAYDPRGRLVEYRCEGALRPVDCAGKPISKQTFTFDALDNIQTLGTEFSGGKNETTYEYSVVDPTQLIGLRHSHPDYPAPAALAYDANGQMTMDEQSRALSYDPLGRLTGIADASGQSLCGYQYDGLNRLVGLLPVADDATWRYFHAGQVFNELKGKRTHTRVQAAGLALGQHCAGEETATGLFATDAQQSVLMQVDDSVQHRTYGPYGFTSAPPEPFSVQGFNGELLDPASGLYFLGNGYRAYSPTLMRFLRPDNLSPFGAGGINPYVYCLGDPINRVDPTGHMSWQSVLGIVLSVGGAILSIATMGAATPLAVIGMTLGVASGISGIASEIVLNEDPDSQAGEILGWVSLGLGAGSAGAGWFATQKIGTHGGRMFGKTFKGTKHKGIQAYGKPGRDKVPKRSTPGGASTSRAAAPPKPWTVVDDFGRHNYLTNEVTDRVALGKYRDFRRAIEADNLNPQDAAAVFPGSNYQAMAGSTGKAQHIHIRLSQSDRLFFLVDYTADVRTVTIKQIGNHDQRWKSSALSSSKG